LQNIITINIDKIHLIPSLIMLLPEEKTMYGCTASPMPLRPHAADVVELDFVTMHSPLSDTTDISI
jgi:hypothetical protein